MVYMCYYFNNININIILNKDGKFSSATTTS